MPSDLDQPNVDLAIEVASYQASIHHEERKRQGVHYTPLTLARFLVGRALDRMDSIPAKVCDPTCGAGTFLLAAAEALADRGVDPIEIVTERLFGADIDAEGLRLAERILISWAEERSGRRVPAKVLPGLIAADLLVGVPDPWLGRVRFDLIVGNPPFLSQLRSKTTRSAATAASMRERFGPVDIYADTAALILLGAVELLEPGGVATMIQPQSFLSARDTAGVRDALLDSTELIELWSSDASFFEASVRVCAVTLEARGMAREKESAAAVDAVWGGDSAGMSQLVHAPATVPGRGESWGPIFATAVGLPAVVPSGGMQLGEIARATAGFRDEFYALVEACVETEAWVETEDADPADPAGQDRPRLITVGMVDPCFMTWGERSRRLGGTSRMAPRLDMEALEAASPSVHRWVRSRLVPKVLVATQTRIIEVAADVKGDCVPVTPLISIEPIPGWEAIVAAEFATSRPISPDLWWLVAALNAPSLAVSALSNHLGIGLSGGALRLSAKSVLKLELPIDIDWWASGAEAAKLVATSEPSERPDALAVLGGSMCRAHGLEPDGELFEWWLERAVAACLTRGARIV